MTLNFLKVQLKKKTEKKKQKKNIKYKTKHIKSKSLEESFGLQSTLVPK